MTSSKIKLREVNRHLVCRLCRGYYVDATTIAECLHSFCRSCIIKYLEKNSFCPICEVQIHKTKPYLNLRFDKALQDVVYKVVPGLYHDEMRRRREFYAKRQEQIPFATPEQCGLEERIIFSPDDSISLSLEYLESEDFESETVSSQSSESGDNPDLLSFPQQLGLMKLKNNDGKTSRRESQDVQETPTYPKRYLLCPAVVNIGHLKKFIRIKYDLTDKMQVNIMHKKVPLPDHYTLMDVAYIYTWKRNSPLRFFYQIYQTKKQKLKVEPTINATEDTKCDLLFEQLKTSKTSVCKSEEIKMSSDGKANVKSNKNKSEIPVSDVKKPETENHHTVDFQKRKSFKVKNNVTNVPETKESKIDNRGNSVLDLISAKLETVTSADPCKPVNGSVKTGEIKKENDDFIKKDESVKIKRSESQNSKYSKKSSVNLLKSFRKEKLNCGKEGKDGKDEIKNNRESSLTITPVSKNEKPSEKETGNFSVETKADNKESEYDFDESSPPGKIIPLQEFCKYSKFSEYMAEHRDKWLSKESKNSRMSFKDFRNKIMNENEEKEEDDFVKSRKKAVPSLYKMNSDENKVSVKKTPNGKLLIEKPKENKTSPNVINVKTENEVLKEEAKERVTPNKSDSVAKVMNADGKDEKNVGKKEECSEKCDKNLEKKEQISEKSEKDVERKEHSIEKSEKNVERKEQRSEKSEKVIDKKEGSDGKSEKVIEKKEGGDGKSEKDVERKRQSSEKLEKSMEKKVQSIEKSEKNVERKEQNNENLEKDIEKQIECEKTVKDEKKLTLADGTEKETPSETTKTKKSDETKSESLEAMDLSKTETTPKSGKNPLENLIDMANKTPKGDEKMVEALLSAAQNHSIEPLLKIPQYSQMLKSSFSLGSPSLVKNILPNEISQALQFLKELRSDMKFLEAKNKLNPNSVLEQFAQKSGNLQPYQQLYQQKIDLIRRLKRQQQIIPNDSDGPPKKQLKLSPTSDSKKKTSSSPENPKTSPTSDEISQFKSSMDRTLSQIQLMEFQSRMLAAQNYKNVPAILQYYTRPPNFYSGPTSPSKSNQQKTKSSSHSPTKSPPGLNSSTGSSPLSTSVSESFFNHQNYNQLINASLNSEMTYHQMFQSYLTQQEQMNQVKLPQVSKKPIKPNDVSPKSSSDKYEAPQTTVKKQEPNNSVPSVEKS